MSSTKAPPLGNLDRGDPKNGIYTDMSPALLSSDQAVQRIDTTNAIQIPVPAPEAQATPAEPAQPPGTFEFQGRIGAPMDENLISDLAGDPNKPFQLGPRAGSVGQPNITLDPTQGVSKYTPDNSYIPAHIPSANEVLGKQLPLGSFQWSDGPTQGMLNAQSFFEGVQQWRASTPQFVAPAIQFAPQQVDPSLAGGFSPTAETKGPYSWFIDGPQEDLNLFKGEFGAMGGGLLGGVGWFFSRLNPTTYMKGAALDVARAAAAGWEGTASAFGEIMKGNLGGSLDAFTSAASENYYSNSPIARGLHTKKIGGSRELAEDMSQSFFLTAALGLGDYSFGGAGTNLGQNRTVAYGENYNPFGMRDPIRSAEGGYIPKLQAAERAKGAGIFHGYDQFGMGLAGLAADVFIEGRIDKAVQTAFGKAFTATPKAASSAADAVTAVPTPSAKAPSAPIPTFTPSVGSTSLGKLPQMKLPEIQPFSMPKYVQQKITGQLTQGPTSPLSIHVNPPMPRDPARIRVPDGLLASEIKSRPYTTGTAVVHVPRPEYSQPISTRYTPPNIDPLSLSGQQNRAYRPTRGPAGIDFVMGGAIVPYVPPSGRAEVPAVLGVGGAPGTVLAQNADEIGDTTGFTIRALEDDVIDAEVIKGTTVRTDVNTVADEIDALSPTRMPLEGTATFDDVVSTDAGVTRLEGPPTPRSLTPGEPPPQRVLRTPAPDTSGVNPRVLITPANTPNYTVRPSAITPDDTIRATHTVDEATGVIQDTADVANIAARKASPPTTTIKVDAPASTVKYVTAEAISPSVSSADIVRRLLTEDIPGAVYNPAQVSRQMRSLQSVVTLAGKIKLPNGVSILGSAKPGSVNTWARLSKKVESAIIASGLNASGPEAQSIRRLFDRAGKPLPENLDPDFLIEVGPRSIDVPQSLVKAPELPDVPNALVEELWTGSAKNYTPRYPLSEDYGVSVAVYRDKTGKYIPVNGIEMKSSKPVQTELAMRSTEPATPPAKPLGYQQALEDARAASKGLSLLETPKKVKKAAWEELPAKPTEVEKPPKPIGPLRAKGTTYDEAPPLTRGRKKITRDAVETARGELSKLLMTPRDITDMPVQARRKVVGKALEQGNDVPLEVIDDALNPDILTDARAAKDYATGNLAKDSRPPELNREAREALSEHSERVAEVQTTNELLTDVATQLADVEKTLNTYLKKVDEMPDIGVRSLTDDVPPSALVKVSEDQITRAASRLESLPAKVPPVSSAPLYHGTRVVDLDIPNVDPLKGASRSELGTGVWFSTNKDTAIAASGRRVPENSVPNVQRTFGESSYVHEIDPQSLAGLNLPDVRDPIKERGTLLQLIADNDSVFSDHLPYGDELTGDLFKWLSAKRDYNYEEFFSRAQDIAYKVANRIIGADPDEYELTYIQRVLTDMLTAVGVDGVRAGSNTVVYRTSALKTNVVHDVTDITKGASDEVSLALNEVNLIQKSLDSLPENTMLQVQLAEAKAVAASKIRDSLKDELHTLEEIRTKQLSEVLDQDSALKELTSDQTSKATLKAQLRDETTTEQFSKELNKPWEGPCL